MTYLFLILRILSTPVANAFQKKIVQNNSAIISNFYVYFILSIGCIPFMTQVSWNTLPRTVYYNAMLSGILCSVGTICLIKALEKGELSILGPINSYKCIIGLVSAFVLLGEIPTFAGFLGMLLIVYGSWFIFETTKEGFSFELFKRRDIQLRFAALIMSGVEAGILKKVIIQSSPEISFYLWCCLAALFSFIILIFSGKKFEKPVGMRDYFTVASGIAIMQLSTNIVFKYMQVGFALALFQLSTLVTLFLGFKMFREGEMKKKFIGTMIMILGSVLILNF
ncbi:EamA family transporter [bacterium]|nr:EamA family transporter [bacterium]